MHLGRSGEQLAARVWELPGGFPDSEPSDAPQQEDMCMYLLGPELPGSQPGLRLGSSDTGKFSPT